MKKRIFVMAAVLISTHLHSQQVVDTTVVLSTDDFGTMNIGLKQVVVTATKYPSKQVETGKAMTVITRAQLDRSSGKSLPELLNTAVGTNIIGANNNLGTNLTTSIRGSSAGNVLILIDGIPVNDPSQITNYFDLNLFSIDQIERIEILKGGQSTLYGSDAVAGVINIITRKPSVKSASVNGSLAGGSYGTFKESIGVSGTKKGIGYSLDYTHLGSNGFSSANDQTGIGDFDKDGIDQHVLNGRLRFSLGKDWEAFVSGTYSYYKTDLDAGAYTDERDYTVTNNEAQAGTGLSYKHKMGTLRFNYSFNYVSRDYLDDSTYKSSPYLDYSKSNFIGRTHFAEVYNNWKWEQWQLLAGLDYRFNNTDQYSLYVFPGFPTPPSELRAKMSQVSPYASLLANNGMGFTFEIGGRWNHHSEYGDNFTFTLNPCYLIQNRIKLFGNLYTAYKTPTLYQLFDPSAGNAALKPEKGIIGETGIEIFASKQFRVRAIGFYRSTKNAIQYITADPNQFISQYQNVSKQQNYGTELEANYSGNKITVSTNYTYTDGKTKSGYSGIGDALGKDTTYYNLYLIPKNNFNFCIGFQATKDFYLSTQLKAISKREQFVYGAPPEMVKGYATIDLYSEYKFSKKLKAFADLKNLTNKAYVDIPGYNSKKFNFMAGVNFQF